MPSGPRHARKFFDEVVLNYDGEDCLLWPFATVKGYGVINIDGKTTYVCQAVIEEPQPSPRHVIAHECGRGALGCVAKPHLKWKTAVENKADELRHGTRNFGVRNGGNILTEAEVLAIKELLSTDTPRVIIGERYGVTREAVNGIAWGRTWSWLTGIPRKHRSTKENEHAQK